MGDLRATGYMFQDCTQVVLGTLKKQSWFPQRVSPRKAGESKGSVSRNSGQEMQALGFAVILGRVLGFCRLRERSGHQNLEA